MPLQHVSLYRRPATATFVVTLALLMSGVPTLSAAADWAMAGYDLSNDHSQPNETRISATSVSGLQVAWTYQTLGSVSATPLVTGGFVYFPDWGGGLHKLEARSGKLVWSHKVSEYTSLPDSVSRTTPVLSDGILVVAEQPRQFGAVHQGAWLLGVDSETGTLRWKVPFNDHPATVLTQSPVVHDGIVFIGTSSNEEHQAGDSSYHCCTFRAAMYALDLKTGSVIWRTPMVPGKYSGAAIWSSTPAIDAHRGLVYITTGNNYSTPPEVSACQESGRRDCLPSDDHIDSFVALDIHSGAIKWATRMVPFDSWNGNCFFHLPGTGTCPEPRGGDLDFGQGPMLFTATVGGKRIDMLAAGQKSGMFWGLERDSGKILWGTQVGPGGQSGGTQWGAATDGRQLYVPITNFAYQNWTLKPSGIIATGGMWSALNPATGAIVWQTAEPTGSWALGPATVANGVLYVGATDPQGHMRSA